SARSTRCSRWSRSARGSGRRHPRLARMQPTVAPGGAPPWWLEEAFAAEGGRSDTPPLEGDVAVDVAIVGGGYTGLWTSLAVLDREPAASVAIVESDFCGAGPSGRNGGFIEGH